MKNKNGSISSSSLPTGYRFKPTDLELLQVYLEHKLNYSVSQIQDIRDVDLYKCNPQKLTELYHPIGDNEWYFFTPRDRKYRSSNRPNRRVSTGGYWKAVATDIEVMDGGKKIGSKRSLSFNYISPAGKPVRSKWMMHEYVAERRPRSTTTAYGEDTKLDDWVLCRLYEREKKGKGDQDHAIVDHHHNSEPNIELIDLTVDTNNVTLPQFCTNESGNDDALACMMMMGKDLTSFNDPPPPMINNMNVHQSYDYNAANSLSMDHVIPAVVAASPQWSTITHMNDHHINYLYDIVMGGAYENDNQQEVGHDHNVGAVLEEMNMFDDPKFYNGSEFMINEDCHLNTFDYSPFYA